MSLGLADALVGVSHECDNPALSGRGLPVLTSSVMGAAPDVPGAVVDAEVSAARAAGESLYRVDRELLASLRPDVVLSQDVCDVCAVPGAAVVPGLPEGATLVMLSATSLSGLEDDLIRVGDACDVAEAALGMVQRLRSIRFEVMGRIGGARRRRVLTLEWGDPPFVGGHWVPEMVGTAGGDHLLVAPGDPSVRSTWDVVGEADAEVVVFMPCGYSLGAAVDEGRSLVGRLPDKEWWAVDASALFSRCTPSSVSRGLHVLAGMLHPAVCPAPSGFLAQRLNHLTDDK